MSPIHSDYIHFIDSNITIAVKPWYKRINKWEVDRSVEKWYKAWLITGSDLRDLGVDVPDANMYSFYNVGEDPGLQSYIIRHHRPEGGLIFETYISAE